MAAEADEPSSMLAEMASCGLKYECCAEAYWNDAKIRDLFEMTLQQPRITRVIERLDEKSLTAEANLGIDAGPLIGLLLKLKTGISGTRIRTETVKSIEAETERPHLMAFAEAALFSTGQITDRIEAAGGRKQYFRLAGGFRPFVGDGTRAKLTELLNPAAAAVIADRIEEFERDTIPRFVYVAAEPRIAAAILIAPPRPDREIRGNSHACYPENQDVTRVYFGRLADEAEGVLFLNAYYVLDVFPA